MVNENVSKTKIRGKQKRQTVKWHFRCKYILFEYDTNMYVTNSAEEKKTVFTCRGGNDYNIEI